MLQEAVPLKLCAGVEHLVADTARVFVAKLILDMIGALWPTPPQVRLKCPLSIEGLVASGALELALSVEPLA